MGKINWFEGGRRITRLLQVLVAVGAALFAFLTAPYVRLTFETTGPDRPWTLANDGCNYGKDGEKSSYKELDLGEGTITLCFRAADFSGDMLVPYENADQNKWYGMKPDSEVVENYMTKREESFRISSEVRTEAALAVSKERWKQRQSNILNGIGFGLLFIVIIGVISWVIGWISRGFAGVPRGMDHRAPAEND